MQSVRMMKSELVEIVRANLQKHMEEYEIALAGYWVELKKQLRSLLNEAEDQKDKNYSFSLTKPSNYKSDYDRAILMLEKSVDDIIELTNDEFGQYVQDEWHWKQRYGAINSSYLASGTIAMKQRAS